MALTALLGHGRWMPSDRRWELAKLYRAAQPRGTLLVETCHRVELYGSNTSLAPLVATAPDAKLVYGSDAARHLIALAVGRDSAVVGEDQVLHQLRVASRHARQNGGLAPDTDRLVDLALHAGRRARSWLPANRPTLIQVAVQRATDGRSVRGQRVHVAGAGVMGRTAVGALLATGATVTVSSRTAESAQAVAGQFGIAHTPFVPEPKRLGDVSGVVVALAGQWPLPTAAISALVKSGAWVVDVSSPPALDVAVRESLRGRLVSVDDLLEPGGDGELSARVLNRLDSLIEETLAQYEQWLADERQRATAHALASRAQDAQAIELERLWQRVPTLDDSQRAEVERTVAHLTKRLLRDPLEQIRRDGDGRHARAARELFRL